MNKSQKLKYYYRVNPSIEDCEFSLDNLLDQVETKNLFRTYLTKVCWSEESLLFCEAVDELILKNYVENQYDTAKEIMNKYIYAGTSKELNISMKDRLFCTKMFEIMEKVYLKNKEKYQKEMFELSMENLQELLNEYSRKSKKVTEKSSLIKEEEEKDNNSKRSSTTSTVPKHNTTTVSGLLQELISFTKISQGNEQQNAQVLAHSGSSHTTSESSEEYKFQEGSHLHFDELLDSPPKSFTQLFSSVHGTIYRQLKEELFPRFINSRQFRTFISKKNSHFISQLGRVQVDSPLQYTDIYTNNPNDAFLQCSNASNKKAINKKLKSTSQTSSNDTKQDDDLCVHTLNVHDLDFSLLKSITHDFSVWKEISKTKSGQQITCSVFQSISHYSIDNDALFDDSTKCAPPKGRFYKICGLLPYKPEDVKNVLTSPQSIVDFNSHLVSSLQVSKFEPQNIFEYPTTVVTELHKYGLFHKNRYYVSSCSMKRENSGEQYLIMKKSIPSNTVLQYRDSLHSVDMGFFDKNYNVASTNSGAELGTKLEGWIVKPATFNGTEGTFYCNIIYSDVPSKVLNYKKKGLSMHQEISKILERKTSTFGKVEEPKFSDGLLECLNEWQQISKEKKLKQLDIEKRNDKESLLSTIKVGKNYVRSFNEFGEMMRLVYVSSYDPNKVSLKEIKKIAAIAIENNRRLGITGMLMYSNNMFYQVIEGSPYHITKLFDKLMRDVRHFDVRCIHKEYYLKEEERQFENWRMRGINVEEDDYFSQTMKTLMKTLADAPTIEP